MASKITKELALLLTGKDVSWSKATRGGEKSINRLSSTAAKAGTNMARNLEKAGLIAGTAFVGGIAYAVKLAGDFEAQMNTINTVARLTPDELDKIGLSIRKIATETGTPLEDLTAAYYDLVSAGISAADAQGVLRSAVTLGIGGLATTAETVDLLTTAINSYGGDASKASHYADVFAKAIEGGKVTAAELAATFAQVGPLAASNGIEIEELAAAYAKFTATGFDASQTSTFMASGIIALTRRTGDLEDLEKATGKSYLAIAGKKGLAAAFQQLRKDAAKTGKPLIDFLGRQEALQLAIGLTGDEYADYVRILKDVTKAEGTASDQASERMKGFDFQVGLLRANIDEAALVIGNELLPQVVELSKVGVDWLKGHQPEIARFARDLGAGVREAVTWAQKLDWEAIGDSLKMGAGGAKLIVGAFAGMPDWVQAAVLTGWGLNKLTGGAVIDFGKIAVDQFAGRGSTPANPVFVSQVGGLPGGKPGALPVGGTGLLASLGLTMATMTPLVIGLAAAAVAAGILDNAINEKGGIERVGKGLTDAGITLGTIPVVKDPERTGNTWLGGKGGALLIQGTKGIPKPIVAGLDRQGDINARIGRSTIAAGDINARMGIAETRVAARDTAAASRIAGQQAAAAIKDKDLSVNLTAKFDATVNVSARDVGSSVVINAIRSNTRSVNAWGGK